MSEKLIELEDGVLVMVEVSEDESTFRLTPLRALTTPS